MGVKIVKDTSKEILARLKSLKSAVLVGIPAANAAREAEDGEPPPAIDNAALGYVMEFGSPANNIPPRPFLVPGVEDAKDKIVAGLRRAVVAALAGDREKMVGALNRVGLAAQKSVQAKMTEGPFAPLAEETKAARLRRKAAYKNAGEKRRANMMAKYLAGDFTPLVDTGQLRNSITYVVRDGKRKRGAK